jgi:hypothetical protein
LTEGSFGDDGDDEDGDEDAHSVESTGFIMDSYSSDADDPGDEIIGASEGSE